MDKYVRFTPDQRDDIWDRANAGESVKSIALRRLRRELHERP
jgi:hypothetical protein